MDFESTDTSLFTEDSVDNITRFAASLTPALAKSTVSVEDP